MAGLWFRYSFEDERPPTFAILKAPANEAVSDIHQRMPVVLPKEMERIWFEATGTGWFNMPQIRPAEEFTSYPVSARVNKVANDDRGLVEPTFPMSKGENAPR
jgi:putative SOS response-associated peptidase YedK